MHGACIYFISNLQHCCIVNYTQSNLVMMTMMVSELHSFRKLLAVFFKFQQDNRFLRRVIAFID